MVHPILDSLYRTALRMTEDRQLAEELTQEACLKAYDRFDRYQEGTNFKAWIFRILTNLCIDHLRRKAQVTFIPIDTLGEAVGQSSLSMESRTPEALAIGRNVEEIVSHALSTMTPELRIVVMLVLVEEMSYAEAATSLDLPIGTVRSRLHRARATLREKLDGVLAPPATKAKNRDINSVITLFA